MSSERHDRIAELLEEFALGQLGPDREHRGAPGADQEPVRVPPRSALRGDDSGGTKRSPVSSPPMAARAAPSTEDLPSVR